MFLQVQHEPESYTPLTNEQSDEKQSKELRVSVYEDGRSDNHTSEINKAPESKVNLIRKSGEEATENTPSQTKTTKRVLHLNRVTLQTMRPTKGMNQGKILTVTLKYFLMKLRRAMVEMRMKMSTHMLPRITRQGHMIKLRVRSAMIMMTQLWAERIRVKILQDVIPGM